MKFHLQRISSSEQHCLFDESAFSSSGIMEDTNIQNFLHLAPRVPEQIQQ